jgi:hypothetical protein
MPMSPLLSHAWYDTPNIHLCTIKDFLTLCRELGVEVERSLILDRDGRPFRFDAFAGFANLLAEQGLFLLRRRPG